jgi:hypothetical protein
LYPGVLPKSGHGSAIVPTIDSRGMAAVSLYIIPAHPGVNNSSFFLLPSSFFSKKAYLRD